VISRRLVVLAAATLAISHSVSAGWTEKRQEGRFFSGRWEDKRENYCALKIDREGADLIIRLHDNGSREISVAYPPERRGRRAIRGVRTLQFTFVDGGKQNEIKLQMKSKNSDEIGIEFDETQWGSFRAFLARMRAGDRLFVQGSGIPWPLNISLDGAAKRLESLDKCATRVEDIEEPSMPASGICDRPDGVGFGRCGE
jgi:hypothetical protein